MSILRRNKEVISSKNSPAKSVDTSSFYDNYLKPFLPNFYDYYSGNLASATNVCNKGMVSTLSLVKLHEFFTSILINKSETAIPRNLFLGNDYNNVAFRIIEFIPKLGKLVNSNTFFNIKSIIVVGIISFFFSSLPILKYLLVKNKSSSLIFGLFYNTELASTSILRNIVLKEEGLSDMLSKTFVEKDTKKIDYTAEYLVIIVGVSGLVVLCKLKPELSLPSMALIIYGYYYFYRNDRDFFLPHVTALMGSEKGEIIFKDKFLQDSKESKTRILVQYYQTFFPNSETIYSSDKSVSFVINPLVKTNDNFFIITYKCIEYVTFLSYKFLKIVFCNLFNIPTERMLTVTEETTSFIDDLKTIIKIYVITYVYCRTVLNLLLSNNLPSIFLIITLEVVRSFDCNDLLVKEISYLNFPLLPRSTLSVFSECLMMLGIIQYFRIRREDLEQFNWSFLNSGGFDDLLSMYIGWLLLYTKIRSLIKEEQGIMNYFIAKKEWIRLVVKFILEDVDWVFPLTYFNAPISEVGSSKYLSTLVEFEKVVLDPLYFINCLLSDDTKPFENHVNKHKAYKIISFVLVLGFKVVESSQNRKRTRFNDLCILISTLSLISNSK